MSSKLIKQDDSYRNWIQEVSKRFRQSQLKAAIKVNSEMLRFYWILGRDMDAKKESYAWGSRFYNQVSKDLSDELPDVKSFSPRNLLYMHQFYKLFPDALFVPQTDVKLPETVITQQPVSQFDLTKTAQQPVSQNDTLKEIFMIPWGHVVQILNKCRGDKEKALFYVHKTIENNWSRAVLLNFLSTDLYERQGKAVTNFALTLPAPQSNLARAVTRDPYNFDFLTIRERHDEKELKNTTNYKILVETLVRNRSG